MKSKLSMKLLGIVVTIATLASLLIGITAAPVSAAAPGALAWATTDTPSNVNNVLGGDSYPGGTLTAIGNPDVNLVSASPDGKATFGWDEANKTLYKSTDGINWGTSVNVLTTGVAVALVVSPKFATDGAVVLATPTEVWLSTNGGTTFQSVAPADLLAKRGAATITSIDVGYWFTTGNVLTILLGLQGALGTATSQVLDFVSGGFAFNSVGAQATDVYAVKISPNAISDGEILCVTAAAGGVIKLSSDFGNLGWNNAAYPDKVIVGNAAAVPADVITTVPTSASIALSSDYVANTGASIIVGINGGALVTTTAPGDVYRVYGRANSAGSVVDTGLNLNVTGVAVSGPMATATVLATTAASGTVQRTTTITTATITWSGSKGVTGTNAQIAVAGTVVYGGTSGADSAMSVSNDGGASFQQVGLIDCGALVGGLLTVSLVNFTPVDANNMFVVMANTGTAEQYVFKTTTAGVSWMRVYTSAVPVGTFPLQVMISTTYATDSTVVIADGGVAIQKSTNGGLTWTALGTPATATTALWVTDGNNIFVGAPAPGGGVYKVGVFSLSTGLPTTSQVVSFALNPMDATKATLLVGLASGAVYESTNNGVSFTQIGTAAVGGGGNAYVAYGANGSRYVAIATGGVFGWLGGAWQVVIPAASITNPVGLSISTDGTVYAASATAGQNVFRTLSPATATATVVPTSNQMNFTGSGATAGSVFDLAVFSGATANSVYIIENAAAASTYLYAGRLQGFSDTMITALAITAPKTGTVVTDTTSTTFSWPAATGAYGYYVTLDGVEDTTVKTGTTYTTGTLVQGSTHTWSVRVESVNNGAAVGSFYSRPSATSTFTMALVQPPVDTIQNPTQGATGVAVDTTFTWPASPVAGATYEFVIAEGGDVNTAAAPFAIIDYSATALTNATSLKETLKYDTQYYWEVRTVTGTSKSAWTVSFFTTEPAPPPPTTSTAPVPPVTITQTSLVVTQTQTTLTVTNPTVTPPAAPIPSYLLWAVIAVGAILVIAVIVLIVRTRKI